MRTYRIDSKTVRLEASDGGESVVLEVSPGGSSSSSHVANVAARPGTSEAAAAGIRRYRIKLPE